MRVLPRAAAALVACSLLLVACDDRSPERAPHTSEAREASPQAEGSAGTGSPAAPEPTVASPGRLRVAVGEITTLDPMRVIDPDSVLVARQLFEGLTRWDPESERVLPAAAEDWDVKADGRRFVFHLRPGMRFHDGSPVTAREFRFAFNRIARKKNASDLAYTLERVKGFVAVNQLGKSKHLRGVRIKDELTLEIGLTEPYQDLPAVLTHPGLVPLPIWVAKDPKRFLDLPIGNGPFELAEDIAPGAPLTLRAFSDFYDEASLDELVFIPFDDPGRSLLALVDGQVDATEVPPSEASAVEDTFGSRGLRPLLAGYYYGVNLDAPWLGRRDLRLALAQAIDRKAIAEEVFEGALELPRGIVPAGMPGFTEDACARLCKHDPERARELVESLPERGRRVTIEYTPGIPHRQIARMVRNDLQGAGLEVSLRGIPFPRYIDHLKAGKARIYRFGWIAEYPVADVFLSSLFASDSPDNHGGFSSGRVDRLLRQAHREASPGIRNVLYRKVERLILARIPVLPIGSFRSLWAAGSRVASIPFDAMGGFDALRVELAD